MCSERSHPPAKVVFCWHMHQPDYRDRLTGEYYFPWTYLHALKDYTDMLVHLEVNPSARAVVNFAPILLEQLHDYQTQVEEHLAQRTPLRDPMLAALTEPTLPEPGSEAFNDLAKNCLRAHRDRMIERFPAYRTLVQLFEQASEGPTDQCYLNSQFLVDMLVWYHLAWLGEHQRRKDDRIKTLQRKGGGFSMEDRETLLAIIGEQLAQIKPGYRQLQEAGRVELAMSPYAHPILPLLLDLNSAREAMPDATLPKDSDYPDGKTRAQWHLQHGLTVFEDYFGCRPKGCWASEGALSDATLQLLSEGEFAWTASGDSVLHNSLKHKVNKGLAPKHLHRAYQFDDSDVRCFFRDDGLSDLIGFQYANWHAEDAVGDLINHLVTIADHSDHPDSCVISIIMDGENAWEYYPENAWHFLEALYRRVSDHPRLEMTTYEATLESPRLETVSLQHLVAGSWVYGTFSTWIGDRDKNRAWEMLCEAKTVYDQAIETLSASDREAAELQLAQCEGSDWFWWFGDYNPSDSVKDFDYLYRRHLTNLYALLKQPAPEYLKSAFSHGGGSPAAGGVMRKGHAEGAT